MTCTITVIVPTFNAAGTLQRCLLSLTSQTHPLHEIVVVDDGSTDASVVVAETFASSHPTVRVFRQQNAGVSAARNQGLEMATGDLIGFVDPDDFVSPDMFALLWAAATESDSRVAALRQQTIREPAPPSAGRHVVAASDALGQLLRLRYPASVCAHLYSRELLRDVRFDTGVAFFEDLLFNFEVLRRTERVALVDGNHYFYEPGPSGANLSSLNANHLSSFQACARIRRTVVAESPGLSSDLAFLEVHCLKMILYKAATAPATAPGTEDVIRAFAGSIRSECSIAAIGPLPWLMVIGSASSPHLVILATRLAVAVKRSFSAASRTRPATERS